MYNEWLDSDTQTFTKSGNVRAPSRTEICDMVSEAWKSIPNEMIAKSFENCGQTVEAKPEDISCMKPGRTAEDALIEVEKFWNNGFEEFGETAQNSVEADEDEHLDIDNDEDDVDVDEN